MLHCNAISPPPWAKLSFLSLFQKVMMHHVEMAMMRFSLSLFILSLPLSLSLVFFLSNEEGVNQNKKTMANIIVFCYAFKGITKDPLALSFSLSVMSRGERGNQLLCLHTDTTSWRSLFSHTNKQQERHFKKISRIKRSQEI